MSVPAFFSGKLPSTVCGFKDELCRTGKNIKIGNQTAPVNNPTGQKIAANDTKSSSGFLSNFKKKVSGIFSGASISSLMNSGTSGNSFVPAAASTVTAPPPPPPSFGKPKTRIGTGDGIKSKFGQFGSAAVSVDGVSGFAFRGNQFDSDWS